MKSSKRYIPYMGGKQKYAERIIKKIKELHPNAKYFYDLFGGGGSVSFYAKESGYFEEVFYNDLDTRIVKLMEHLRVDGVTEDMRRWYSQEEYKQRINEQSHIGGLLATCYSFGNNGKNYMYNPDVERYKQCYHNLVMFGEDTLTEMVDYCKKYVKDKYNITQDLVLTVPTGNTYTERRLHVRKQLNMFEKNCKVSQLRNLQQLEKLQQLEQLEGLQQLQQLERLERLERFPDHVYNLEYQNVPINTPLEETVIYCDPPYKGTGKYKQDVDHEDFYKWVKDCKYPVFVSSYDFELSCVMGIETRSTMSSTNNSTKATEKLFYKAQHEPR